MCIETDAGLSEGHSPRCAVPLAGSPWPACPSPVREGVLNPTHLRVKAQQAGLVYSSCALSPLVTVTVHSASICQAVASMKLLGVCDWTLELQATLKRKKAPAVACSESSSEDEHGARLVSATVPARVVVCQGAQPAPAMCVCWSKLASIDVSKLSSQERCIVLSQPWKTSNPTPQASNLNQNL